jgi:hypothetical protein
MTSGKYLQLGDFLFPLTAECAPVNYDEAVERAKDPLSPNHPSNKSFSAVLSHKIRPHHQFPKRTRKKRFGM